MTWRRLHDIDLRGLWFFIFFVPLVGAVELLVLNTLAGTRERNRSGPSPQRVVLQTDPASGYGPSAQRYGSTC